VRAVRRLLTLGLLLACACQRGAQVEALPLADAEPPVIVVGPKPDAGKTAKAKKSDAGAARGRDAAAGADTAGRSDPAVDPARGGSARAPSAPPSASPGPPLTGDDALDDAVGRLDDSAEDDVPTLVLDERAEAERERAAGRATPSPSRGEPSASSGPRASSSPPAAPSPLPAGSVSTGAKGPLVLAHAARGRLDVLSRDAELLGRIELGNTVIRGVAHDRRSGDGVWVLLAGSPPLIAKIGWDGRRLRAFEVRRPPLRRARAFVGIDHVLGHSASSDLLLVLYVNTLGLPVVEGLRASDGSSRFTVGFSREADVSGVRADGFRHDAVDGLLVMDWWTIRAGTHLERWRFFYGFVDRLDDRRLSARLDAFDIPPWREVWGVDRAGRRVVRLSGDGELVTELPARDIDPAFLAISP
jgi:hypothetical protein